MFFFFKKKTAYEMRISDWSSDVCSSDLVLRTAQPRFGECAHRADRDQVARREDRVEGPSAVEQGSRGGIARRLRRHGALLQRRVGRDPRGAHRAAKPGIAILKFGRMVRRVAEEGDMPPPDRSEEHRLNSSH